MGKGKELNQLLYVCHEKKYQKDISKLCDLEISENFFKSCSKWNNPKTGLVDKRTSGPANTGPVPIPVRLVAGFVAGLKNHKQKKIEIYISSRLKKYFTPH